jgi:hypothetical protein
MKATITVEFNGNETRLVNLLIQLAGNNDVSIGHISRSLPTTVPIAAVRNCVHCGRAFTPRRRDARYCGGACRASAYRARWQASLAGLS